MHNILHGLWFRLIVLALLTSGISLPSFAEPFNCGNGPIRLAFFDYGLLYFEKDGQGMGIDKDLVDELTKRSGCKFSSSQMPRARVWNDLAEGNLDMTVSGLQTPEREQFAWFMPYLSTRLLTVMRAPLASSIRSADAFEANRQLQFGVVRSFKHEPKQDLWLAKLRQKNRVQESANVTTMFEKLKLGRIDAIYALPIVFRKLLKELDMESNVVVQDWTPNERGAIGCLVLAKQRFSRTDADQWRNLVRVMQSDGTLMRIYARYVPASEARKLMDY